MKSPFGAIAVEELAELGFRDKPFQVGLNIQVDPPRRGKANMAIDASLLSLIEQTPEPVTFVRFYRWENPTVSIGKHQVEESVVDGDYCRKQKIDVVRRPTGGRAVLHHHELTYAVISNQVDQFGGTVASAYLLISRALRDGLHEAGIDIEINAGAPGSSDDPRRRFACFSSVSRYELTWRGRKIVGSAQRRLRRSFLQHGSIPLSIDYTVMAGCLRSNESVLRQAMVSVAEASSRPFSFEQLQPYLQRAFESKWGPSTRKT